MQHSFRIGLAALLVLSACVSLEDSYGRVWSGAETGLREQQIQLPPNAPSLSNVFYESAYDTFRSGEDHLGIDIIAAKGTPIIAPAAGRVTNVFSDPFYGNNIIISHGTNADGAKVRTQYKHLTTQIVNVGDTVIRGQQIGTLGRTGLLAGGILHLHFEVQIEGRLRIMTPVDPNSYWMNGPNNITCFDPSADWPDQPFRIIYPVGCR